MFGRKKFKRIEGCSLAPLVEALESRTLMSDSASAQLHLVSTGGTQSSPVFNYDITLTNTGTTNLGTFWFGWVPDQNLLPSTPTAEANPSGWSNTITGSGNSLDGAAIQWVAQSAGAALAPGQNLTGFDFSSSDSPTKLAGQSPAHQTESAMASFVYAGAPFSDAGFGFTVTGVSAGANASNTSLVASAPAITAGQSDTLTATVAPATPGGAVPTGTVTFLSSGTVLGTAPVQSDGTAVFPTTALPVGTDSLTASYGGDSTYAASSSSAITVTVSSAPVQPALTAAIAKSTLPASVVAGAKLHDVVTIDVTNQSASLVKGSVTVDLYASTDGLVDGSAVLVTHITRKLSLKSGKIVPVTLPVKLLPANLPNGNYTLVARVIDPSSNAEDSTSGPAVMVAAPFISLSESFAKLTLPQSIAAGAKEHAVAAVKIINGGTDIASGPTTVSIYLSGDGLVDGTATLFKTITKSLKIRPGKPLTISLSLTQVPSVAPGDYFVVAGVTDPKQQMTSIASQNKVTVTA